MCVGIVLMYSGAVSTGVIQFNVSTANVAESDTAMLTVSRTGDLSTMDVVLFSTSDGSAQAGLDYAAVA